MTLTTKKQPDGTFSAYMGGKTIHDLPGHTPIALIHQLAVGWDINHGRSSLPPSNLVGKNVDVLLLCGETIRDQPATDFWWLRDGSDNDILGWRQASSVLA